MTLKEIVKLTTAVGQPFIKDGLEYYIEDGMLTVRAVQRDIVKVNIEAEVEIIGKRAFSNCTRLESIYAPGIKR